MAWDEEYYQQVRITVIRRLNNGEVKPDDLIGVFSSSIESEDYEGAKATRDAVFYWMEKKRLSITDIKKDFLA